MNKIKVVHHSKTIGYSGTDRTAQLFCKYLTRSNKYEPFLVYRIGDEANTRLDIAREWLGEDHVIGYEWTPGKKGTHPPYLPEHDNLYDVLRQIDPQIVHMHRSGYQEWPGFKYLAPKAKWVETNIFGYNDSSPQPQFDLNIYISEFIANKAGKSYPILYNPIEQPALDMTLENRLACKEELLEKFKIPHNAILLGRVGRPDNFDPISLRAFSIAEKQNPNLWYIVVNPCQSWITTAKNLGINNIRFAPPIIDDKELSKFYMGLDIYAHARHDGECCPCNIQEAMMHNLPIISHESAIHNGQSEIIGDAGFVVPIGDFQSYSQIMLELAANQEIYNEEEHKKVRIRDYFGRCARRRAMRYFEAEYVTYQLVKMYDYVLTK